jgi:hypothetical protein
MYTRTRLVPLLLAGVYGALFTLGLEQLLLPPRAGLAFGAQATPPVIQAQQFELVDPTGAVRGVLRMTPEGTGPEVALLDETGHRRATMTENSEGEYAFNIFDASGAVRFGVGTTKRGFVGLNVRDGHGVIRSNLYANDDGADTGFRTWDADGHVRTKLGAVEGEPATFAVRVFDEQGQPLWRAP